MSATDEVISEFFSEVMRLAAEAQQRITGAREVAGGSRCLAWAVKAGLPPQMHYTVADTARYSGIDKQTLYREHDAGRLPWTQPRGREKGARIAVEDMDRWLEDNTR